MIRIFICILSFAGTLNASHAAAAVSEADKKSAPVTQADVFKLMDEVIAFPKEMEAFKEELYAAVTGPVASVLATTRQLIQQSVVTPGKHAQFPKEITNIIVSLLDSPEARLEAGVTKDFIEKLRPQMMLWLTTIQSLTPKINAMSSDRRWSRGIVTFLRRPGYPASWSLSTILESRFMLRTPWPTYFHVEFKPWQDSGFVRRMKEPGEPDRILCEHCGVELQGLQPWMQPLYYHDEKCPMLKKLAAQGIVRKEFGQDVPTTEQALKDYTLLHVDLFARKLVLQDPESKNPLTKKAQDWIGFHRTLGGVYGTSEFMKWTRTQIEERNP